MLAELEELAEGQAERIVRVAGDPLFEKALRRGTAAVRLFQVSGNTAGERCHREHDPQSDQPSTQGEQHLLDGGQCGSRVSTTGCHRVGAVGRDCRSHERGNGEGPPNGLAQDTVGMPRSVEITRRRERRLDASINEKKI